MSSGCLSRKTFSRRTTSRASAVILSRAGVRHLSALVGLLFAGEGAFLRDGSDFDNRAIGQAGALLGDGHGFVEAVHRQEEIAADGFFGFREGAIGHDA